MVNLFQGKTQNTAHKKNLKFRLKADIIHEQKHLEFIQELGKR